MDPLSNSSALESNPIMMTFNMVSIPLCKLCNLFCQEGSRWYSKTA